MLNICERLATMTAVAARQTVVIAGQAFPGPRVARVAR
jgi:hypothetical protein